MRNNTFSAVAIVMAIFAAHSSATANVTACNKITDSKPFCDSPLLELKSSTYVVVSGGAKGLFKQNKPYTLSLLKVGGEVLAAREIQSGSQPYQFKNTTANSMQVKARVTPHQIRVSGTASVSLSVPPAIPGLPSL